MIKIYAYSESLEMDKWTDGQADRRTDGPTGDSALWNSRSNCSTSVVAKKLFQAFNQIVINEIYTLEI